jgi:hypothetical protein
MPPCESQPKGQADFPEYTLDEVQKHDKETDAVSLFPHICSREKRALVLPAARFDFALLGSGSSWQESCTMLQLS